MDQLPVRRLFGPAVAMVLFGLTIGAVAASGATHASARIVDAAGDTIGWARFVEDEALAPGRHGIHLHSVASCVGPAFTSAGGHHNPLGMEHGLANAAGAHAGDLPNLMVNVMGHGHLQAVSDRATLSSGPVSLFDRDGSAVIIHAAMDDQVTNPTGNSGARVACGVIRPA
jgi:Cu-Zn family superoxide dismutase